ncbi:hypothetical protein G6F56_008359 [Rhizopus delemar]|nr:hypothetical protein G6F56_008359 [Rhizopus delemar]
MGEYFTNCHKIISIIQSDHAKTISMFPRENGLTRIFVHFSENEHEQRKEQHNRNKIQVEDIQREAKRALLPHRIEFLGILYWSVYVVGQRYAERLDAEDLRIFLCGDAAHSQSPTLGQGVNTGFGDIFNLVWKICMVEKGQLDRKLLSTYHLERWPVAQNVLKVDRVAAKAAAGHEASDYCEVVEQHRAFTAGFGIKYEDDADNLLLSTAQKTLNYTLQAGMRAPNYKVYSYATSKKTRLFDVVVKNEVPLWLSFTLLVLASDLRSTFEKVSTFLNETSKTASSLPPMNVVVVTTSTADQISTYKESLDSDRVVIDKLNQAQCHRAYHRKANSATVPSDEVQVVLVRPDGYIGTILRGETSANDLIYQQQQKRHLLEEIETDLLPTDLVLVFTLDGSIRGMDRYDGRSYWTLQGGHKSSLIKADSQFKTHGMKLFDEEEEEEEEEEEDGFHDMVPDVRENGELKEPHWKNETEQDVYYIVEPQEGGTLYIYGDGRPLEKLPFSIKDIVTESPIRTKDEREKYYNNLI